MTSRSRGYLGGTAEGGIDDAPRDADAPASPTPPPMPTQSGMVEEPEPTAWRREWDGDVSDLGQFVYAERGDDLDNLGIWEPLYGTETVETLRTLLAAALKERDEAKAAQCHHGWRGSAPDRGQHIVTPCPACGNQSLFIGSGGHLTCARVPTDHGRGCDNPGVGDAVQALRERATSAERALENERMKVAGCSTAAMGAWKEGDTLHPDYECAAIHDVARLYVRADSAERALGEMRAERDRMREALQSAQCPDPRCVDGSIISTGPDPQNDACEWCYYRHLLLRDAALSGAKGDGGDK